MIVSEIGADAIFKRGDHVELSIKGLAAGVWDNLDMPVTGEVIGFCRDIKHAVRIRLKGRKSYQVFAWWFWQRAEGKRTK